MISIAPFQALLPDPDVAQRVATVPYDVVDRGEAAALAGDNPLSFLRVSRAEIELPDDANPCADAVYRRAEANFARLRQAAPLRCDPQASLYVYAMTVGGRRQTGLAAALAVDDYDRDAIKKHEATRADKEEDRTRHLLATRAHTGPVFLVHRSQPELRARLAEITTGPPLLAVRGADGSAHEVWRCPAALTAELVRLGAGLDALYIADGHHRAKAASRARAICRQGNPAHTGAEAYNRFLGVLFPHDQVEILPYNRLIFDLSGLADAEFLDRVGTGFAVSPRPAPGTPPPGVINLYLEGRWYALQPREPAPAGVPAGLDVSVLQERLLQPVLGIANPRTSRRLGFVGGRDSIPRLMRLVDDGTAAAAFALHPVRIEQLLALSDRGEHLPPKSTWFEPKLRDGLLVHCF